MARPYLVQRLLPQCPSEFLFCPKKIFRPYLVQRLLPFLLRPIQVLLIHFPKLDAPALRLVAAFLSLFLILFGAPIDAAPLAAALAVAAALALIFAACTLPAEAFGEFGIIFIHKIFYKTV